MDFNPSSPSVRGMEWRPTSSRTYTFDSSGKGLAQRFRSPGTVTLTHAHDYLSAVVGNAGVAVEIVDTLTPYQTVLTVFPGTNTGANEAAFLDETGAAASYVKVAKNTNDATYLRATSGQTLSFRGTTSALTGKRICSVTVKARGAGDPGTSIAALLIIGGTSYFGSNASLTGSGEASSQMFSGYATYNLGTFALNPSTGLPWTQAQVNGLIGSTDSFGVHCGQLGPSTNSYNITGLWLEVVYVTENRHGYAYQTTAQAVAWTQQALTNTSALAANTWYWLVVYGFGVSSANSLSTNILADPSVIYATSASSGAGEHRQVSELVIGNGGVATASTVTVGEMIPFLLEISGTIQTQSQPYAELNSVLTGNFQVSLGQEITSAVGATTYGAIKLVLGWQDPNNRPDAPLGIDVRHGAGMLTGAGTLDVTATIQPGDISTGQLQVVSTPAVFTTQSAATQYALYMTSNASPGRGWAIGVCDTRSDLLSSGTTVAMLEGASQGTTTDSYFAFGTEYTRQDFPASVVVAPAAPAAPAATPALAVVGANGSLAGPNVTISWTATSLTTAFQEYRVYRRPARLPVAAWSLIGRLGVPSGYTPATVEAQHTTFTDWQPGWYLLGGEWADGWDYAVTVVSSVTGVESPLSTLDLMNTVTPDAGWWVTNNAQPWLNFPVIATALTGADSSGLTNSIVVGRDGTLSRTRLELPMRSYQLTIADYSRHGEDPIRPWRAAASTGATMALLGPRGDRAIGALDNPSHLDHNPDGHFEYQGTFQETQRTSPVAGYNQPAGLVLNGTTQYVDTPTNGLLNPGSGGFTVFVAAVYPNSGTVPVGKGDLLGATTNYYGFARPASNQMQFSLKGATTFANVNEANPVWFDGNMHVATGTSTGSSQVLYRDGTSVASTNVTHGAITNTVDFFAGASSGTFIGLAPLRAWGYYPRTLTATEAQNLSYYLLGYPGFRPPAGANVFYDLRDQRCWNGITATIADASGNNLTANIINGPATRGIPAPYVLLDRYG